MWRGVSELHTSAGQNNRDTSSKAPQKRRHASHKSTINELMLMFSLVQIALTVRGVGRPSTSVRRRRHIPSRAWIACARASYYDCVWVCECVKPKPSTRSRLWRLRQQVILSLTLNAATLRWDPVSRSLRHSTFFLRVISSSPSRWLCWTETKASIDRLNSGGAITTRGKPNTCSLLEAWPLFLLRSPAQARRRAVWTSDSGTLIDSRVHYIPHHF